MKWYTTGFRRHLSFIQLLSVSCVPLGRMVLVWSLTPTFWCLSGQRPHLEGGLYLISVCYFPWCTWPKSPQSSPTPGCKWQTALCEIHDLWAVDSRALITALQTGSLLCMLPKVRSTVQTFRNRKLEQQEGHSKHKKKKKDTKTADTQKSPNRDSSKAEAGWLANWQSGIMVGWWVLCKAPRQTHLRGDPSLSRSALSGIISHMRTGPGWREWRGGNNDKPSLWLHLNSSQ